MLMRKTKLFKNLIGIPILLLSTSILANNPKKTLAVDITDVRVIGEPKVGNKIIIEVDFQTNTVGLVELNLFTSKFIQLDDVMAKANRTIQAIKGSVQTERFIFKVIEQGASQINIVARINDASSNFKNYITKFITIENDASGYDVYSSLRNGSVLKSTKTFKHEFKEKRGGQSKESSLKSATATQSTNTFYVNGTVIFFDGDDYRYEGLYGSKVKFWFRNSSTPNQLWHPYLGDAEHATYANVNKDGSFYFSFTATADFSGYNQIVLLVEPTNPYISYSPPSGYIISTDQGSIITFGYSEGAVLTFNPNTTNTAYSSVDMNVNSEDGGIIKSFMFAGELVKQKYNGNMPFSMPFISVYKQDEGGYAGGFHYSKSKVWDFWPISYHWEYSRYIGIDPSYTDATTICHEYGHFVTYQMWGGTFDPMSGTSDQVCEGWAIFYSFAARNYANRIYSDGIIRWDDNTEEAPFNSPRFRGIRYADAGYSSYAAFACYLWNLYDGYNDGIFKSSIYNGDNDDVSGYGLTVFEKMRSMSGKNPSDFNNLFKNELDAILQLSAQNIYDNMLVDLNTPMRSAQLKSALGTVQSSNINNINISWQGNTYSSYPSYSNRESGYRLYQRASDAGSWTIVSTIANANTNYMWNSSNAYAYKYKLSSYNASGNSYGDILLNLTCDNITNISNVIYNSNATVNGCSINVSDVTVQNNAAVILDGIVNVIINGPFELKMGSSLEVK
jgi:hypothetical protein